jgi:hypothetical protein
MRMIVCLALVSCDHQAAPATPPAAPAGSGSSPPPGLVVADASQSRPTQIQAPNDVPPGWTRITPDPARFECAKRSEDKWRVSRDGKLSGSSVTFSAYCNTVVIAKDTNQNAWQLPFKLPATSKYRGSRHVKPTEDGFLVGIDAAEHGGGLYWFSDDGSQHKQLGDKKVHGFVEARGNLKGWMDILSFEGMDRVGDSQGDLRILEYGPGPRLGRGRPSDAPSLRDLKSQRTEALDATPLAFDDYVFCQDSDVFILTAKSLEDYYFGQLSSLQPLELPPGLDVNSLVTTGESHDRRVLTSHNIWIGMRHLVLRLVPSSTTGSVFDEEWYVPDSCKTAHLEGRPGGKQRCVCGS